MKKYKFKSPGASINMRGRDPIFPDSLSDKEVEELLERHPELANQFDELKDETKEKPKKEDKA